MDQQANQYETTTGHSFSTKDWLNLHYKAVEKEYDSMVQSVGIQPGWRVLDAACGNGCFIHKLSELVGVHGRVDAIDLAPENIAALQSNVINKQYQCHVYPTRGNIMALPYETNVFDAVWCSAVTQFLSNDEFQSVISEFIRVVKPGGVIAIKEFDGTLFYFSPSVPTLLWNTAGLMDEQKQTSFLSRPIQMKTVLTNSGLLEVTQKTYLIEKRQPLNEVEKKYISAFFDAQDVSWVTLDKIPENDRRIWKLISNPTSKQYILNEQGFYWREGHIVAVGIVPSH